MGIWKCMGNVVGEERTGLVIAGERKSARADSCGLVTGELAFLSAWSSSARSRPGGDAAVDGASDEQKRGVDGSRTTTT